MLAGRTVAAASSHLDLPPPAGFKIGNEGVGMDNDAWVRLPGSADHCPTRHCEERLRRGNSGHAGPEL